MSMINKIVKLGASLLLILVVLPVFQGCQKTNNNTYKRFTFTKGIKFSFEYPSHYYKDGIWAYKPGISQEGGVTFFDKLPSDWYWYDNFGIGVEYVNKSADEAIQKIVNNKLKKEIEEISNVTMAGMQGEMLVYSYQAQPLPDAQLGLSCSPRKINHPDNPNDVLQIDRIAYFSDGDQLWSVEIGWSQSKTEQQKADFEHILQTFKILD
jgi:hypothetical protein